VNRRIALALSLVVALAGGWWFGKACAPDFLTAVFSYKRHPDLPRSRFIEGKLGVLQPTFARSYLVIAYRYLNGIGMNPREREQARDYYKDRDTGKWDGSGTDWPAQWREVRSHVHSPQAPPTLLITDGQLAYDPETHSFTLNCAEDAFRIAIQTLKSRRTQFGAASRAFRSWVEAQDKVFENCGGGEEAIPSKASADLPAIVRADRDYQIAAADFYAGNYEAALDGFRHISQDAASPWKAISRYLVVRTLLRMTGDEDTGLSADPQLRREAQSILADSKLASIRGMTWNLVERAGIRQRDQTYFQELGRLLSSTGQDNGLREELWNYTDMYDGVIGKADPNAIFAPSKPVAGDPARFRDVDLSDWIFCFQSRDSSVFSHSLERWKQTRSAAWLLAALAHASAATADKEALLRAAVNVSESSPAYLTARFHLYRLYEQIGDKAAARDGLTQLLASSNLKDLPSSVNLFRGLRMLTAPTFEDFVEFAVRKPVMVTTDLNMAEAPFSVWGADTRFKNSEERFDRDGARLLNHHTPFRLLKQAALGDSLPAELRGEALMTAFTRGLMLGEDLSDIARKIAAIQPDLASLTDGYLRETTDEGRQFAAAFLLLRRPEARPYFASGISRQTAPGKLDPYRDNWWCPMDIEAVLDSRANTETPNILQHSTNDVIPEFITAELAAEAKRQFAKLGTMSAATDFLGGIVFQYAKTHYDDARIPEALHNLVRSGHYGCTDVNTWKTTQAAFRMLHLRYPGSEWTKRTPIWVKNDFDIRREMKTRQDSAN